MENKIFIREAASADAPAIARVHVDGWRSAYAGIMPAEFLRELSVEKRLPGWIRLLEENKELLFVAVRNGVVRGFISGGKAHADLPGFDSEVYAIYVDEQARGLGAGGALLRSFFEKVSSQGARSCALWVLEANSSRKFYEKLGGVLSPLKKTIEIGGEKIAGAAYAWENLGALLRGR
jgi:ribosomal protein S18 acetylase RimI-like enzyme